MLKRRDAKANPPHAAGQVFREGATRLKLVVSFPPPTSRDVRKACDTPPHLTFPIYNETRSMRGSRDLRWAIYRRSLTSVDGISGQPH